MGDRVLCTIARHRNDRVDIDPVVARHRAADEHHREPRTLGDDHVERRMPLIALECVDIAHSYVGLDTLGRKTLP
jgi:voltage-gated potassium channel Kch